MGTYVTDDPVSLRQAAAQLRYRAEVFTDIAAQVDSASTGMVYVGPAGDQYRSDVGATSAQLRAACGQIADVANRLLREADRVEAERTTPGVSDIYYD